MMNRYPTDPASQLLAGRLVSAKLESDSVERFINTIHALAAEAARRGLTDKILDTELAAYNLEPRGPIELPEP